MGLMIYDAIKMNTVFFFSFFYFTKGHCVVLDAAVSQGARTLSEPKQGWLSVAFVMLEPENLNVFYGHFMELDN